MIIIVLVKQIYISLKAMSKEQTRWNNI